MLRVLLPVVGLIVVLAASYGALTHQRYDKANGVPGEILPGHSVGQTFVARYPNLSGIKLRVGTYIAATAPAKATLILHLRTADQLNSKSAPDLATATLPAGTPLGENPWFLFSFPPIADSQNRAYYIEVESPDGKKGNALTLFWWQPASPGVGDPYQDGAAHLDGKPQPGDLSIRLHYSPSPLDAWGQMLRALSPNFPPALMIALLIFVVAGSSWGIARFPYILRDWQRRRRWLARWSLPAVLLVALVNGLIYLLAIPPWQGPDEHAHLAYAALLDRYDFDVERVRHLDSAEYGDLAQAVTASMDRNDFTRRVAWHSAPGATADGGRSLLWEAEQPPAYYWLSAVTIRAVRSVGFHVDPYLQTESALRVVRGVSLLLSLGVVALAWLAGTLLSPRGRGGWPQVLLPLTIALLPMHAFVASTANNDLLAELAVSALFVTIVALLKYPLGLSGPGLAVLSVALTLAGSFTKSSALAASVPLLLLGLFVWAGMLATKAIARWRTSSRASGRRNALVIPAAMGVLALLLVLAIPFFAFTSTETAVGWNLGYWPVERATLVHTESAHDGSSVLQLGPSGAGVTAQQVLVPPMYHQALDVTFSGWARISPGSVSTPVSATAMMLFTEGSVQAGSGVGALHGPGEWTQITGTARISESTEQVTLRLVSFEGMPVQFDDLTVSVKGVDGPWNDPIFGGRGLLNPSFEAGASALNPFFSKILPFEARQIADALANPQPFDKGALWSYYAGEQYRSFWGNFGWVSVPLADSIYVFIALLILLALAGLARTVVRRWGRWSSFEWVGLVSLVTVVAATLLGFARQMMLLADLGIAAYPQGRYLFVLIVPITWLLLVGAGSVGTWVATGARRILSSMPGARTHHHTSTTTDSRVKVPWSIWLWASAVMLFAAYCLLVLILPYYYG
jgi:hypothetical protein